VFPEEFLKCFERIERCSFYPEGAGESWILGRESASTASEKDLLVVIVYSNLFRLALYTWTAL